MNQNFCSYLLKKSYLNIQRFIHNSGSNFGNHYDTLKLKRNCTAKEIRESFIKLSKKNHPDVNSSPKAHKEFVKIQEAYNVLSKPGSRSEYDLGLACPSYKTEGNYTNVSSTKYQQTYGGQRDRNPWNDPYFYDNRDRSKDRFYEEQPYYGIKGVQKVSNSTMAVFLVLIGFLGFVGQMILIRYAFGMNQERLLKRSQQIQEEYNKARERANRNGNELQAEIMRQKFEEAEKIRRFKLQQAQDASD